MTNKDEEEKPSRDSNPRLAALLAVHLVSQVLDEAYVIANAAQDSGQPWRYISMLKNFKNNEIGFADDEDESYVASKGDNVNENNIEVVANIVATSTPQKIAARLMECSDEILTFNDSTLIGQGDEEIEIQQNDLTNSTSMFINHLFDMSDVERIILCDDTEIQSTSEPNDLLAEAMNKIMDSYVSNAFQPIEELPAVMGSFIANTSSSIEYVPANIEENVNDVEGSAAMLTKSDHSEYSFMADAFVADIGRDVTFYIEEDGPTVDDKVYERLETATAEEITEDVEDKEKEAINQKNDFELYEKAYMTLNRDYDQCSEDDRYPVLQDPKELILHEVELMTANTSDEEQRCPKASVSKPEEEEPTVSGISGSRKSTLVRKCRYQGAKLFACLRGWWRRRTPGKRLESRRSGLAVCPLSPNARRRTSSLLENRLLRSPSASRPVTWKFNTVNETLVNSNRWKDYTFDSMAEGEGNL